MKISPQIKILTILLIVSTSDFATANQEITGSYMGHGNGYEEGLANFKYAESNFWIKAISHCKPNIATRETDFHTMVATNGWDLYTYTSANVVCR